MYKEENVFTMSTFNSSNSCNGNHDNSCETPWKVLFHIQQNEPIEKNKTYIAPNYKQTTSMIKKF